VRARGGDSDAPEPPTDTCSTASTLKGSKANALTVGDGCRQWRNIGSDRSSHRPSPAGAPPTIGPKARRTGLLPVTPSSSDPKTSDR
jgi:hypothetical protein